MKPRSKVIGIALGLVLLGCETDAAPASNDRPWRAEDAGVVSKAGPVDVNLAKAVKTMANTQTPNAESTGGPPASGIFASGQAEKELAATAKPKVVLGSPGSSPRLLLTRSPLPPKPWNAILRLRLSAGKNAVPPLQIGLRLRPDRLLPESANPSAKASDVPPLRITTTVTSVDGGGADVPLPEHVAKALRGLVGSEIRFLVAASGGAEEFETTPSRTTDLGLADVLQGIVDGLSLSFVAMPQEPIGAGGYFLVTSRDHEAAVDVITYRMVRVERISDVKAVLAMTTRRYATGPHLKLAHAPDAQTLELQRYESRGEGRIELDLGVPFPQNVQVSHELKATIASAPGSNRQLGLETRLHCRFTLDGPGTVR